MKTISEGRQGFMGFVGKRSTCTNCGAVVELDEQDARRAREHDDQRDGQYWQLAWSCPTCQRQNSTQVQGRSGSTSAYYDR